jgi:hypothetical protein
VLDRILNQMRNRIRTRQYIMTVHAEEEMDDDDLSILDVESVVLTGAIVERQKDAATGERKYVVRGKTLSGDSAAIVGKVGRTGRLVFITVYRD